MTRKKTTLLTLHNKKAAGRADCHSDRLPLPVCVGH